MKPIDLRFFSYVDYSEGCWNWTGNKTKEGYGKFTVKHKHIRAHRWAYEYFRGPLGEMHCLHECDNPSCVNPFHLWLGTNKENLDDMLIKNRHHYKKRTHCKRGHEYTKENTAFNKSRNNARICIICRRQRLKEWRENAKKN
jgi:hypothetical protein